MSFRVYVHTEKDGRKYQILGNNEWPKVLFEELKKQGCEFDEDFGFENFEIKDLQGVIQALEKYIFEMHEKIKGGIANFSYILEEEKKFNLKLMTSRLASVQENGYVFITANFLKAIGEENYDWDFDKKGKMFFKVAEGKHIYMSGY